MLTVVIETRNDEEALARTLGSLVAGAVEGMVREVIVHDRGSTDHTAVVADHAGCHLVHDGELATGLRRARGEWLLLLEPGAKLSEGWMDAVLSHVERATIPARFSRNRKGRSFLGRIFSTRRPLADGFLISRPQALSKIAHGEGVEALMKGASPKKLAAEILPAERRAR